MTHTSYLIAAYAITLVSLFALLGLSWARMRKAERAIEKDR